MQPFIDLSIGRVFSPESFCETFNIDRSTLDQWVAEGLPILRVGGDDLRITETAFDDWHRQRYPEQNRKVESPFLDIDEAAEYCKLSKKTIYNNRSKIKRQPGVGKLLFRPEDLDEWLATRPKPSSRKKNCC